MSLFESPLAAALNHLLDAEDWARARLAPFCGEVCEVRARPFPAMRFRIAEGGTVAPAGDDAPPALTLQLGPDVLPALARGEDHFMRAVEVSGNARLATEVLFLVRHLRWDVEEDLALWVGDAVAHRLVLSARQLAAWPQEVAGRVTAGLADYAFEERQWVVRRPELSGFAREVAALRDALERLELRIERQAGR